MARAKHMKNVPRLHESELDTLSGIARAARESSNGFAPLMRYGAARLLAVGAIEETSEGYRLTNRGRGLINDWD